LKHFFFILLLSFAYSCAENIEKAPIIEKKSRDWNEIKADCVLTVLAENSPASYFIYRGKNMGYEYELLHEFSKDNSIRLQIRMVNDLDEMMQLLQGEEGDIIACNLTKTDERASSIHFSVPHLITHQVLIQRKPDDYKKMKSTEINDSLITEIEELRGKTIHVWKNSTYYRQILRLNDKLNLDMKILATDGGLITEELIRKVSLGEIDYTIADENVAKIDLRYYPNLDIGLKLSGDEEIAFGLRNTSTMLKDTLDAWLTDKANQSTIGEVKRKYFKRKNLSNKANADFSSLNGEEISPYDAIIKRESELIGWDWRLISSIIYQESKFEVWKESWAGAFGIFQFMPATAIGYGISPSSSAEDQIKAGIKKLRKNFNQWNEEIKDSSECFNFTLATFNSGRGHVDDARALAIEYGLADTIWYDNVDKMIKNLSNPVYYRNQVVKNGYCRGIETYEYVIEVMQRYNEYKAAFPDQKWDNSEG